jgi:EmrB/QacA subfamily drug resistance transporter
MRGRTSGEAIEGDSLAKVASGARSDAATTEPEQHAPSSATVAATGSGRLGALVAIAAGSYMASLNGSIVNSILPIITSAFGTEVATIEWVVVTFLLVQSGLLLTFGRIGDIRGQKLIYLMGLVVFATGSVLCGSASSAYVLIGARALQAVGGAMLFSSSPAILTRAFPANQRGRALGMQSTMVYLGLASGPPLGGWLADALGWRSVFFANIPVGLLAFALSWRFLPWDSPTRKGERFDIPGARTYVLGLVGLLLALNQGHAWGWTSLPVLGLLAAGLALLGLFAFVELHVPMPMLNLALFRARAVTAPVLSAVCNYMGVGSCFFLVPFYLIEGRGLSPSQAGLILTSQPIVMAITASLSGSLSDKVGSRLPSTVGMIVLTTGLLLLSRADASTPLPLVSAALALIGLGIGLFTSPNSSAVIGAVPPDRRGVASGILATARSLGNVLGIGIAGAIFTTVLSNVDPSDIPILVRATSAGLMAAAVFTGLGAVASASRPSEDIRG